jgi:hypothetical protein
MIAGIETRVVEQQAPSPAWRFTTQAAYYRDANSVETVFECVTTQPRAAALQSSHTCDFSALVLND